MLPVKKRKVDSEMRIFKECWTEQYFFICHNGQPLCPICQEMIAVKKEFNIKRHYESKHSKYSEYTGLIRIDKIKALKKSISKQQMVFTKINENSEKGTRVSLAINHLRNSKEYETFVRWRICQGMHHDSC